MPPPAVHDVLQAARWRALGTSVHLLTRGLDIEVARTSVERVLDDIDLACSRFRADSELQILQAGRVHEATVSPLLGLAIATALQAARQTGGAVDPTVGRAMRAIGYDDDFSRVATRDTPFHVRLEAVPGWRALQFDARRRTLSLPRGVELDLGSTGKALAADLAAGAALGGSRTGGVLVSLGGDVATAGRPPAGGWRILASEDSETPPDAPGEVIAIDGGAVATSSTVVRRWRSAGGGVQHHIIDPRTGAPASGPWRTATVVADRCVDANTVATAAIVLGPEAVPWLESIELPARLVGASGEVVRLGRWPQPGATPGPTRRRVALPALDARSATHA